MSSWRSARCALLPLLAVVTIACGGRSVARPGHAETSAPAPSTSARPASPVEGPTLAADGPTPPDGLAAVERAFAERRLGHVAEARAVLDDAGLAVGDADTSGVVLRPRGGVAGIAFEGRGASGTAFFDAKTGEPIGLVSRAVFVHDELEVPNAAAPGIFVGTESEPTGAARIYDAKSGALLARGPTAKIIRDGATAYVASEDQCAWSRWDLLTGRLVGELERFTNGPCWEPAFTAELTDDGKALIGIAWWDLDTRAIHETSAGRAIFRDFTGALSRDQNHVAFLLSTAPDARSDATFVALVDRRTGALRIANEPLPPRARSKPLRFAESPTRLLVYPADDYVMATGKICWQYAFRVPSLSLLARIPADQGLRAHPDASLFDSAPKPAVGRTPPSADETAPLRALLSQASCARGGFIVPRDLCATP